MGRQEEVSVSAGNEVRPPVSMLSPRFSKLSPTFEISVTCYQCP